MLLSDVETLSTTINVDVSFTDMKQLTWRG